MADCSNYLAIAETKGKVALSVSLSERTGPIATVRFLEGI
jgi:hypothetical protein